MVLRPAALLLSAVLCLVSVARAQTNATSDGVSGFNSVNTRQSNAAIEAAKGKGEAWVDQPFSIAVRLFGPDAYTEGRVRYSIDYNQSRSDAAIVTVTAEGGLDDSVSAERRVIQLNKRNDIWAIDDIKLGVKCQTGRGHATYSGQPCR